MRVAARRPSRPLARGTRGLFTLDILLGITIGSIVIGGFILFWLSGTNVSRNATTITQQESGGLAALNRIAKDVSNSQAVAEADNSSLVLIQKADDGSTTWVKYALDANGNLYKQTRTNAPATFDPDHTGFAAPPTLGFIVRDVKPAADGQPLFSYVTPSGTLSTIPAYNPGNAAAIKRVDISFAAHTRTSAGYVELHTSAALSAGPGGNVAPYQPACPVPVFVHGQPDPTIEWAMEGQTTEFRIYRSGGNDGAGHPLRDYVEPNPPRGVLTASTNQETYGWTDTSNGPGDPDPGKSTTPIDYRIVAVGAGGESQNCGITKWYPPLQAPKATVTVEPATTESYDWYTSRTSDTLKANSTTVDITWPAVLYANTYEVYKRELDPNTFEPIGSFSRIGSVFWANESSNGTFDYPDPIDPDTAWEYQVVAQGPMPESSPPSVPEKVLAHTAPIDGVLTADPIDYHKNDINWDGDPGPTATGLAVYRRDLSGGCAPSHEAWELVAKLPLGTYEYEDDNAELGSRYEYMVGAYNFGPRGNAGNAQYASMPSTVDSSLQYPPDPQTYARGSSGGDTGNAISSKGINTVTWSTCGNTTSGYTLDFYRSGPSANSIYKRKSFAGNVHMYQDGAVPGWSTGWIPRASIRWYKAAGYNATGASPNASSNAGAVAAYQYPNNFNTPVRTYGTDYYHYTVEWDGYYNGRNNAPNPPSWMGSCSFVRTHRDWTWDTRSWTGGHGKVGQGYESDGTWEPTLRPPNPPGYFKLGEGYRYGHWHYNYYWKPIYDEYQCDRYSASVTFRWGGGHPDDDENGGYPFCGVTTSDCWYGVKFNYSSNDPYLGSGSDRWCKVGSGNSCTWYAYSGELRRWNVDAWDTGYADHNPGGTLNEQYNVAAPSEPVNLQPDQPVFTVQGSKTNKFGKNQVRVGRNVISWSKVDGATGYRVLRFTSYSGGNVNTGSYQVVYDGPGSSGGCASGYDVCFTDNSVDRGTETYYSVVAYNRGYVSTRPDPLAAYQQPTDPQVNETQSPTADDPSMTISFDRAADKNQPAGGQFCDDATNRGRCTYQVVAYDNSDGKWLNPKPIRLGKYNVTLTAPLGVDADVYLRACNRGGCAQTKFDSVNLPPGPFKVTDDGSWKENVGVKWSVGQQINLDDDGTLANHEETLAPTWSKSEGATYYWVGRVAVGGGDPWNLTRPTRFTSGSMGDATRVADPQAPTWESTPGAEYRYTVWAAGPNKKTRKVQFVVLAQPAKILMGEVGHFCKQGVNPDYWKGGWRLDTSVTDTRNGDERNVNVDRIKYAWWAGVLTDKEFTNDASKPMYKTLWAAGLDPTDVDQVRRPTVDEAAHGLTAQNRDRTNADTDWNPDQWGNQGQVSAAGQPGFWFTNVSPRDAGYQPGQIVEDYSGGNNDNRVLGYHDKDLFAFQTWTWIDMDALSIPADVGQALSPGNAYGLPRTNDSHPSADGACPLGAPGGSGWHKNKWNMDIGRWASEYRGYQNEPLYGSTTNPRNPVNADDQGNWYAVRHH